MKRRGFFGALVGAPVVSAGATAASATPSPFSVHPSMVRDTEYYRATKEEVDGLLRSLTQLREQCGQPFVVNVSVGGRTSEVGRLEILER